MPTEKERVTLAGCEPCCCSTPYLANFGVPHALAASGMTPLEWETVVLETNVILNQASRDCRFYTTRAVIFFFAFGIMLVTLMYTYFGTKVGNYFLSYFPLLFTVLDIQRLSKGIAINGSLLKCGPLVDMGVIASYTHGRCGPAFIDFKFVRSLPACRMELGQPHALTI